MTRRFGTRAAVRDISFSLEAGECLAIFGPNGAGKTTLLRLLGGLLRFDGGEVTLAGLRIGENSGVRRRIGVISHRTMLYPALTALENVEFSARLYGIPDARMRAEKVLSRMAVDRASVPVRLLSRGMQQRVSIARAIVNGPTLLLADEPYTGLDELGAQALTAALRDLTGDGSALILVTHQLNEGLELADRVALMHRGTFLRYQETGDVDRLNYAAEYRELVSRDA